MDDERLLTVKEVAERLQANPQTIRKWVREGRLRGTMPGGEKLGYRIPASEVTRLLEAGKAAA
jgi:excisionase family DNA binding protein